MGTLQLDATQSPLTAYSADSKADADTITHWTRNPRCDFGQTSA